MRTGQRAVAWASVTGSRRHFQAYSVTGTVGSIMGLAHAPGDSGEPGDSPWSSGVYLMRMDTGLASFPSIAS